MLNMSLFTVRNVLTIGFFAVVSIFIYKKISTKLTGASTAPAAS